MAVRRTSQDHGSGILNVLFHGAFTFVLEEQADQILALIPRLQEHVYRAGSWLAETELYGGRGATYELEGVKAGTVFHFDPNKNLLVKFKGGLPKKPAPYVTLRLPKPRKITSLRVAEVPSSTFTDRKPLEVRGEKQHMATLQVLTYDIANDNELRLKAVDTGLPRAKKVEDHYWEPAFTGNYVNLHIFSSEDYYHKPSNANEDLNRCVALLGVKMRLNVRFVPARGIKGGDVPHGVTYKETEDLGARTRRLAQLGRRLVQNGDADLAWYDADVLDGTGEACADAVGVS